ncbi:uncharacterized protein FA14DRAFT_181042 [Meira miltonrushii]|uniref:Uncharacterized protein n=1 Tax=Meira miltonrushii TaxID=1280837 RepID=A0A316VAE7_9BASI|nr:uncharacterized protein FA14DRAFT_181042 [Meira miltonrushii]PWN34420.1 hypothetical protein FA14DRAFT_181042 [Meira miltonrushii]
MHLSTYLAYIIILSNTAGLVLSNETLQRRSGLTPIPANAPSNSGSNVPAPRIVEGINLGHGRGTNPVNNRQRYHMHPELPANHPIRPQQHSSVQYEEDKPGKLERLTGKKRKREGGSEGGAANDHEAGPSGTKEEGETNKPEERPRKKYRHYYKSSGKMSKEESKGAGKLFGAVGAAVSKKAKSIYRAGQRTVQGVRDGCGAACQGVQRAASRLRNRLTSRRDAGRNEASQGSQPTHTTREPGMLGRMTGKKRKREGDPEGGTANDHEAELSGAKEEEKTNTSEERPRKRYRPTQPFRRPAYRSTSASSSSDSDPIDHGSPPPPRTRRGMTYRPRNFRHSK